MYRFLAEHRLRLFPDEMFGDLFGSGRGRPSVPGSVVAVVLVLQALEGCSDREAAARLRCDLRWKAAAGLAVDDAGFHYSVLSLWRARLRASACPERVFDAVRELAASCGALAVSRRRALDSTVLYDAVATQDTYTMISAQIRRCRRLIAAAAGQELAHGYDGRGRPGCDWDDPGERARLVDELVADARAVLAAVSDAELTGEQADAVGLLAAVAGQDVEPDPDAPGRWRIARRVAPGRVISVVDPEARHARKTRSQRVDGYKAHIVAEPDTGIITAAELTAADASDAQVGARLLQSDPTHTAGDDTSDDTHSDDTHSGTADTATADTATADTGTAHTAGDDTSDDTHSGTADTGEEPDGWLVLADSAYASGEALESFTDAGWDTAIKPIERRPRIKGGFTRDDFDIDTGAGAVTCPAGHTRPVRSGAARFGRLCADCPLKERCTTSEQGRSVTVDAHEAHRRANKDRWRQDGARAAYRRHRPLVERSIAWLKRGKARRVPGHPPESWRHRL